MVCTLMNALNQQIPIPSPGYGWVTMLMEDGLSTTAGNELFAFEACQHHIVMRDLCAECGANLRREGGYSGERITDASAKIPMVHTIPDLHVSETVAAELALQDEQSLLAARKLVLLVDLDETVLHTTNDPHAFKHENVHRYRLAGSPLIYHTSFRPHLHAVLKRLSKYYQMHICTFGNRTYAHQLASMIDPQRRYFAHRILSRDECFNPVTKSANLKALFPRGLNLVCIIDDRGEVWDWSPHLIQVKPYRFFQDTQDLSKFRWSANNQPSSTTADTAKATTSSGDEQEQVANESEDRQPEGAETSVTKTADNAEPETESHIDNDRPKEQNQEDEDTAEKIDPTVEHVAESSAQSADRADDLANTDNTSVGNDVGLMVGQADRVIELEAADNNYLLRLQEILISLHRSYYQEYDRWRYKCKREHSGSPSLSSSSLSQPPTPKSSSENPLETVNQDMNAPNLAHIIAQHRRSVLGPDCHVTLSGLAPSHLPERCFAARIVRSLGAVLHNNLRLPPFKSPTKVEEPSATKCSVGTDEFQAPNRCPSTKPAGSVSNYTTHLVVCRRGTEKYNAATKYLTTVEAPLDLHLAPLHIVSPHWLWSCHFNWQHLPESDFPLTRDYHPSEFDPDLEPAPGTTRYARRYRRHRSEYSPLGLLPTHSQTMGSNTNGLFKYHVPSSSRSHHHHRHRYGRSRRRSRHVHHVHHMKDRNESLPSHNIPEEASTPQLDVSLVQSALESIRMEKNHDRKRARHRKHSHSSYHMDRKRHRRHSHTHFSEDSTGPRIDNGHSVDLPESKISSPNDYNPPTTIIEVVNGGEPSREAPFEQLVEIQDADDDDDEEELDELLAGDEYTTTTSTTDEQTESDQPTASESVLQQYLPPPKPLILADNPLMHLPPQATSQMLAEIEDAVMEEETEKIALVPAEAELYDPAKLGLGDTTDSSVASELLETADYDTGADDAECRLEEHHRHVARRSNFTHQNSNSKSYDDDDAIQWQVQRELLLRRRCRASPLEVKKIDRKLRRLHAAINRDRRRRSADDLAAIPHRRRAPFNLSFDDDEEEENVYQCNEIGEDDDDVGLWDTDYPKGWGPEDFSGNKKRSRSVYYSRSSNMRRSISPAIHSDPEPSHHWWTSIQVDEQQAVDAREWNTCPEGYDYVDAERSRALFRQEGRTSALHTYAYQLHRTHVSLTDCLLGEDEEEEDEDSAEDSADGATELEDLADACWDPLREFM